MCRRERRNKNEYEKQNNAKRKKWKNCGRERQTMELTK